MISNKKSSTKPGQLHDDNRCEKQPPSYVALPLYRFILTPKYHSIALQGCDGISRHTDIFIAALVRCDLGHFFRSAREASSS